MELLAFDWFRTSASRRPRGIPPLGCRGRRPYGQYRARCGAHDPLGDAAYDQMAEPRPPVRRHDDQICLLLFRDLDNFAIRDADDETRRVTSTLVP